MHVPTIVSREYAVENGLKRYFTGVPCKIGHVCEARVSDSRCIECERDRNRSWHEKNAERVRSRKSKWYEENKDFAIAITAIWNSKNKHRKRAYDSSRSAIKRKAKKNRKWTSFDEFVLLEAAEACKRRELLHGVKFDIDHMIPLSKGGLHAYHNLQVIPSYLNCRKKARLIMTKPGEWIYYV